MMRIDLINSQNIIKRNKPNHPLKLSKVLNNMKGSFKTELGFGLIPKINLNNRKICIDRLSCSRNIINKK